ncbi:GFA family protein [Phenylobacterium soli]|uniref:Aldehyde-activating protein n=1 Tax=Phenylobacterium soli TaxID=2170551 RepID=A0A328AJ77_9CAUL|nr:GFA family protein [Phenylobacterium soli]RAK54561.1 aldehyde-activating protein [Phenylobacterium soli]
MSEFTGGCACGAVRYRLTSGPMFVHCCHCQDCQRQAGSAFAANALIETDRIVIEQGRTSAYPMPTDSGWPHDIHRCEACGTALWSDYGRRPAIRFVRATTLDDRGALEPDVHIFTRSKLPWVRLAEGARVFEVYYDMRREWPPESLERRRAALGDV